VKLLKRKGVPEATLPFTSSFEAVVGTMLIFLLGFSLAALPLAMMGAFRPVPVVLATSLLTAVLIRLWGGRFYRLPTVQLSLYLVAAVATLVMAVTVLNFAYSSQHLPTNRDPGVYVNTGLWLARTGQLVVEGDAGVIADFAKLDYGGLGYYEEGRPGRLEPQFLHLLPAVLAVGEWLGGPWLLLRMNALLGGVALLVFFTFAARIMRPWLAFLATAALSLNLVQVHFTRDAFAEILTQVFLFGGLWALHVAETGVSRPGRGLVAGLLLGGTCMTRIDALLYLIPLVLYLGWRAGDRQVSPATSKMIGATTIGLSIGPILGLADGWLLAGTYLSDLGPVLVPVLAVLLGSSLVAVGLAARRRWVPTRRAWLSDRRPALATAAAGLLIVVAAFGYLLRPHFEQSSGSPIPLVGGLQAREGLEVDATRHYAEFSLRWLSWYLHPMVLFGGILGTGVAVRRALLGRARHMTAFLGVFLVTSVVFLWRPTITPDHIWAMRRFLPVTIPGLLLLGFWWTGVLVEQSRERVAQPLLPSPPQALRRLAGVFALVLAYAGVYAVVTWPWVLRMWSEVPAGPDEGMLVWGFAWMRQAVEGFQWPFTTTKLLAPWGATLAFHAWTPLLALLSVPFQWVLGPFLSYNLVVAGVVILIGLCTYALARDLGLSRVPSLASGALYASAPPVALRYGLLGHLNLAVVFWIPLVALLTRRVVREPTRDRAILLGAAVAGALLSDHTIALYSVATAASYVLARMAVGGLGSWRLLLRPLLWSLGAFLVFASPMLVAMSRSVLTGLVGTPPGLAGSSSFSADVVGWLVADARHPILGDLERDLRSQLGGGGEGTGYLGVILIAAGTAGFILHRHKRIAWWLLGLALAAMIFSLGPVLMVLGRVYVPLGIEVGGETASAVMPYTWLQAIPGLANLRAPARTLLIAALPLAVLSGLALESMRRLLPDVVSRSVIWSLILALALLEGLSPVLARAVIGLPPTYQAIAQDPDPELIVVDVPLGFSAAFRSFGAPQGTAFLYAAVHEKRIASGIVSRIAPARVESVASIPLYRDLVALQSLAPGEDSPGTDPSGAAQAAKQHHVKYVVVRKDVEAYELVRSYLEEVGFSPVLEDPWFSLFQYP
jgi:hypothetical protein